MMIVRVELHSAITGAVTELARMEIANDGQASADNPRRGNYTVRSLRGRDTASLDKRTVQRRGTVWDWRRQDFHVWNLVRAALTSMAYFDGQEACPPMSKADERVDAGTSGLEDLL